MMFVLFVIGTIFLPKILTNRGVLIGLVDRFGGIAPLKLDLEQVQAGWFQPISAQGIQLKDAEGKTLVRVGKVETEKGILGWIMNSTNLGKIRVASVEADVVTYDGTSNIEEALKPLLSQSSSQTPNDASSSSSSTMLGELQVVDTRFTLSSRDSSQHWILNVPELSVILPSAGQVIGPIKLQANLGAATNGSVLVKLQRHHSLRFLERARIEGVPSLLRSSRRKVNKPLKCGLLSIMSHWTFGRSFMRDYLIYRSIA